MKFALAAALFAVSTGVAAETAKEAAMPYETVMIKIEICRQTYDIGVAETQLGRTTADEAYKKFVACRRDVSSQAASTYKALVGRVKSPDGKAALKDFHATLMTRLESIEPKSEELKIDYRRRQGALDDKLQAAWQRLQLEF